MKYIATKGINSAYGKSKSSVFFVTIKCVRGIIHVIGLQMKRNLNVIKQVIIHVIVFFV